MVIRQEGVHQHARKYLKYLLYSSVDTATGSPTGSVGYVLG